MIWRPPSRSRPTCHPISAFSRGRGALAGRKTGSLASCAIHNMYLIHACCGLGLTLDSVEVEPGSLQLLENRSIALFYTNEYVLCVPIPAQSVQKQHQQLCSRGRTGGWLSQTPSLRLATLPRTSTMPSTTPRSWNSLRAVDV